MSPRFRLLDSAVLELACPRGPEYSASRFNSVEIPSREMSPEPLVLAVLFGCNLCYATPIAYQTNMLIMGEGSYEFSDYIRTGVPLVLLMVTTLSVLLVLTYRL